MRSLEIRTQRIFNNLIKQNQKLASDFVLKQSEIVSSAQSPTSSIESPESSVQTPASNTCVQSPGILVCQRKLTLESLKQMIYFF